MSRDVVLYDEEINKAAQEIKIYGAELAQLINSYSSCVRNITEVAIKDKLIVEELNNLLEKIKPLQEAIDNISSNASDTCSKFIKDIDETDSYLY